MQLQSSSWFFGRKGDDCVVRAVRCRVLGDITTLNIVASIKGDQASAYCKWNAKHTGPVIGMIVSGREIEMNHVDIFRLKDGKFADR